MIKKVSLAIMLIMGIFALNACKINSKISSRTKTPDPQSIYSTMKKVSDWQLDTIVKSGWRKPERTWTNGVLFTGLLKFAELANNSRYYDFMEERVGKKFDWQLYDSYIRYHADFYCVGQMYSRLYSIDRNPRMIEDLKRLADTLVKRPHTEILEHKDKINLREWNWCDALFMAPPALAMLAKADNRPEYLDLADKLWWRTSDYLYDTNDSLYYRDSRFKTKKEKNGEKVFWSRGNGWVIAGLARVMDEMPDNYHAKSRWIAQFKEMATKIAKLQLADGTWRSSLLDPESYNVKETSGTAFFCYAMAWGINKGILDEKTFAPVVLKSWKALTECVHPNGKLGYVQPIGASPAKVSYEDTEVYGVGGFLLAGSEVLKMSLKNERYKSVLVLDNLNGQAKPLSAFLKPGQASASYRNLLDNSIVSAQTVLSKGAIIYLKPD